MLGPTLSSIEHLVERNCGGGYRGECAACRLLHDDAAQYGSTG
jgi:hypothetical protein